jgi:hypothetical protein
MPYSSGPREGVIPHPIPEVNFLMVEIPTNQMPQELRRGVIPILYRKIFEYYTYL